MNEDVAYFGEFSGRVETGYWCVGGKYSTLTAAIFSSVIWLTQHKTKLKYCQIYSKRDVTEESCVTPANHELCLG